jgi:hypothetical protein
MKILVNIEGGIGKNVAATGAVKVAKDAGHEVDVLTAWPQVWIGNPNVNKVLDFGGLRYFTDELKGYDKLIFHDPYREQDFIQNKADLTATFNLLINGKAESVKPEIYLNKAENIKVRQILSSFEKPIMVFQTNGGHNQGYSWSRDLPLEETVDILNEFANDYELVHLRANGQLEINGVKHTADLNIRECLIVLQQSQKRLLIDSVYQHAAAAMGLKSTVVWVSTEVEKFGYDMHDNIKCNVGKLKHGERTDFIFGGLQDDPDKCPFADDQKILPNKKIIDSLKKIK